MRDDYEERKERRILSLLDAAERAQQAGQAATAAGDAKLGMIPLGQPILIGHHSEKRDRNYRNGALGQIRKGYELQQKAADLQRRAEAAESNRTISSDDPEAVAKLKEKIAGLEAEQEKYRRINQCVRRKDNDGLRALGLSDGAIAGLYTPDFCGRVGIPDYQLSNNSANIRRLKQRLVGLQRQDAERETGQERTEERAGARMRSSAETNRTQIFFPGKPPADIIRKLKSCGFRWSPSEGAWQRFQSHGAEYAAAVIMGHYAKLQGVEDEQK